MLDGTKENNILPNEGTLIHPPKKSVTVFAISKNTLQKERTLQKSKNSKLALVASG